MANLFLETTAGYLRHGIASIDNDATLNTAAQSSIPPATQQVLLYSVSLHAVEVDVDMHIRLQIRHASNTGVVWEASCGTITDLSMGPQADYKWPENRPLLLDGFDINVITVVGGSPLFRLNMTYHLKFAGTPAV